MSYFSMTTVHLLYNQLLSFHDCIIVPKELFWEKKLHTYYCCASNGPNHPYFQENCNDVVEFEVLEKDKTVLKLPMKVLETENLRRLVSPWILSSLSRYAQ